MRQHWAATTLTKETRTLLTRGCSRFRRGQIGPAFVALLNASQADSLIGVRFSGVGEEDDRLGLCATTPRAYQRSGRCLGRWRMRSRCGDLHLAVREIVLGCSAGSSADAALVYFVRGALVFESGSCPFAPPSFGRADRCGGRSGRARGGYWVRI